MYEIKIDILQVSSSATSLFKLPISCLGRKRDGEGGGGDLQMVSKHICSLQYNMARKISVSDLFV